MILGQLLSPAAAQALNVLSSQPLKMKHIRLLDDLISFIEKERQPAIKVQEKFAKKLEEKDEETIKEWQEFLSQEVEFKKLPYRILDIFGKEEDDDDEKESDAKISRNDLTILKFLKSFSTE